jgi:Holliday junction resolvase RusA-like endonuclease
MSKYRSPPESAPIRIGITAKISPPSFWPAWKQSEALRGVISPTGKPDIDNIIKAVSDALNGTVWIDDSQVIQILSQKVYSESPGLKISVYKLPYSPASIKTKKQYEQLMRRCSND